MKQTDGVSKILQICFHTFASLLSIKAFYASVFSSFSLPFPYHVCPPLNISGSSKNMWL